MYNQRKQEELEKHIRKSTLNYSFGEQVQMDAAFWIWFGNESTALHLAVDKATKKFYQDGLITKKQQKLIQSFL